MVAAFDEVLAMVAAAEQQDGWLIACQERGVYLAISRELVETLAKLLRSLGNEPVLEVCAGDGRLAQALGAGGVAVIATDAQPLADSGVERLSATEALARYEPAVVLGSFVPVDSGVDAAVLAAPSVRHYVVLNARLGGLFGSAELWQTAGWTGRPLPAISRRMITRHDAWLDEPQRPILQHGEAWHWQRGD
jgi:hypothetical protein